MDITCIQRSCTRLRCGPNLPKFPVPPPKLVCELPKVPGLGAWEIFGIIIGIIIGIGIGIGIAYKVWEYVREWQKQKRENQVVSPVPKEEVKLDNTMRGDTPGPATPLSSVEQEEARTENTPHKDSPGPETPLNYENKEDSHR